MDRTQFCCNDFESAVDKNMIIDENTFNHTIKSLSQNYLPINDYATRELYQS